MIAFFSFSIISRISSLVSVLTPPYTKNIGLSLYLSNNKSYKSSTIKRILASITYKYRINNFDFDRKNPQIAETMAAISRNKEIKPGQKKELLKE